MIQTHHRDDAIGFPGDDTTKFDTDIVQLGRAKGVELPATKAEFKKKYGIK